MTLKNLNPRRLLSALIGCLNRLVRAASAWAWQREIATCEGIVKLRELHMREGAIELEIEQHPELALHMAHCFASLVADAPNYVEMKFDVRDPRKPHEWLTVLIQQGHGKTPHQLRMEAESKLSANKEQSHE